MLSTRASLAACALAALAAAGPSPARAADCSKPVTQTAVTICAAQDRVGADEALNAVYGKLVKEPSLAGRLDTLRAAERAWVAYRDAQCAFEGSEVEGGSMQPMVVDGCATTVTRQRTAALRSALACARDGAGC